MGDDDTKTTEMGLPKNLFRSDQLVIVIGLKSILRFPQPKQAQPDVQPAATSP